MKKLLPILIFALAVTSNCFGQSFQEDLNSINTSYNQWYLSNATELSKKLPLDVFAASPNQIKDSSHANALEKGQINAVIKKRNEYALKINELIKKYTPDTSAANALIANYQELIAKSNQKLVEVRDSKLSFGTYIKLRQNLLTDFENTNNSIAKQYHLDQLK